MMWKIAKFVITVGVTYYWATLVQYVFHRIFGHENRIRKLFRVHLAGHHGLYPKSSLIREKFNRPKERVGVYFLVPMVPVFIAIYFLAPLSLFLGHTLGVALAFWVHFYLHKQYHLSNSWLNGRPWFERKRQLHFVHHANMKTNYAIIEFTWDRIFRTLRNDEQKAA